MRQNRIKLNEIRDLVWIATGRYLRPWANNGGAKLSKKVGPIDGLGSHQSPETYAKSVCYAVNSML